MYADGAYTPTGSGVTSPRLRGRRGVWRATVILMDAKDVNPADQWPLPPSWMWACSECVERYAAMKQAPEAVEAARRKFGPGVDCDPMDSVASTQIRLARHIVVDHEVDIPAVDPECERCVSDAASQHLPRELMLEHRSRHLFAPPSIAGRM